MARYRSFRDLDGWLLILSLIISALGVLQIYSATHDTKWHSVWWKQLLWIVIGLGLHVGGHFGRLSHAAGAGSATLLCLDRRAAVDVRRGRSGFSLAALDHYSRIPASIQIQMSEFEKIVIILLVARYLSELKSEQMGLRDLLKLGVLVGIPTLLVWSQPDFGTGRRTCRFSPEGFCWPEFDGVIWWWSGLSARWRCRSAGVC